MDRYGRRLLAGACLVCLGLVVPPCRADYIPEKPIEHEYLEETGTSADPLDFGGEEQSEEPYEVTLYVWPETGTEGEEDPTREIIEEPIYPLEGEEGKPVTTNPLMYYTMVDCQHPPVIDNPQAPTPTPTATQQNNAVVTSMPEPSSLVLLGLGSLGLGCIARRRRR